jgi:hypothetical protein
VKVTIASNFRERQTFRVIVILPLLPGFEGDLAGATGNSEKLDHSTNSEIRHQVTLRLYFFPFSSNTPNAGFKFGQ